MTVQSATIARHFVCDDVALQIHCRANAKSDAKSDAIKAISVGRETHTCEIRGTCTRALMFTFFFLFSSCLTADTNDSKAIYGEDDRMEAYRLKELKNVVPSIAALLSTDQLTRVNGRWQLPDKPRLADRRWCSDERFNTQLSLASCTAFLISPNRVVTSAHCLKKGNDPFAYGISCRDMAIVFDFALDEKGEIDRQLDDRQVYGCRSVPYGSDLSSASALAVIELDKSIDDRIPLTVYSGTQVDRDWNLALLGHPSGLPAKVAPNGNVVSVESEQVFVSDLDAYQGNSGSPVVVMDDEVPYAVGVLSGGEKDFVFRSTDDPLPCKRSRICDDGACRGERVTLLSTLAVFASKTR